MLAKAANINPALMNQAADKTRPDVKPLGYLINGEQPIKRGFLFGHHSIFLGWHFRWFHVKRARSVFAGIVGRHERH